MYKRKPFKPGQTHYFISYDHVKQGLSRAERAWILAAAMGYRRFAMNTTGGAFAWPGNTQKAKIASQEPIIIMDLLGDVFYEYKGHSEHYDPANNTRHLVDLIKKLKIAVGPIPEKHGNLWEARVRIFGRTLIHQDVTYEDTVIKAILNAYVVGRMSMPIDAIDRAAQRR